MKWEEWEDPRLLVTTFLPSFLRDAELDAAVRQARAVDDALTARAGYMLYRAGRPTVRERLTEWWAATRVVFSHLKGNR